MSRIQQFLDRWVQAEERPRGEVYRQEAGRIRAGDPLSWAVLLTGFVPLAAQNPHFAPVWIALAALWWMARRRGWALKTREHATHAAAASMGVSLVYFVATHDTLWAFILFLVLMALVLIHKLDLEVEVPRLYLVAFTLFLVFSHLTLEYTFVVVLFAMVLSGLMLMLRYHFPEQLQRGRYLATAKILARPVLFAVLLTVPVFVVSPRVPVATLQLQQAPHTAGFGDKIKFGDMRSTLDSDRLFMTVRTPKAHKWRGIVLDFYDGKGWRRTPRQGKRYDAEGDGTIWLQAPARPRGREALESAEVILEPTDSRYYFAPQWPAAMEVEFGAVAQGGAHELIRTEDPQAKRLRYVIWSGKLDHPDDTREREDMAKYLKLLPHLPASIGELAHRVTAAASTDRQRAEAIDRFLAEGEYTYTLGAAPPADRDPVAWFLTESKSGHCEYFSSAMALMLRTLGIPSRVVNGFNPGRFDEYAGTWTIYERNCHSWVEAYLPGEGWVEFDPTTGNGREAVSTLAQRLGLDQFQAYRVAMGFLNRVDFEWQRYVVSFSVSMQLDMLQAISRLYDDLEIRLRVWLNRARLRKPSAIAAALVLLVLAGRLLRRPLARLWRWLVALLLPLLRWLRDELTRISARRRAPEVGAFYRELTDLLERHGIAHPAHETPWEFARRLATAAPALSPHAAVVTDAYCRVAYRGATLAAPEADAVSRALAAVHDALRGSPRQ